jgi:deferrochelatase/peroxidase EfeB
MSALENQNADSPSPGASRRGFLTGAAGLMGAAGAAAATALSAPAVAAQTKQQVEPFWGPRQAGIITPAQTHTYFAAFDLQAAKREDVAALLRVWTEAAARMTSGQTAAALGPDGSEPPTDSGEVLGLSPSRLTLTFGFGPDLFVKDGQDRYGLAHLRPRALVDLPRFNGDQLIAARTGGDLSIQACADDPQVVFHAVRQLSRLASGAAQLRWSQPGFVAGYKPGETGRNLMGFKDGTMNPLVSDPKLMDQHIWVGEEGGWMRGGSYLVARPVRIALEHWDRMTLAFQEQTMGRQKVSGAALGKVHEFDPIDLGAVDQNGDPVIPENSHVRLAAPATNDGVQILRRSYSYDNGLSFVAERWPPWRQGMEFDAGLLFVCYQRDPRTGFVKMFEKMAKFDMMNQFVTHIGGGLFACPPGAAKGTYVGQALFEAA